MTANPTIVATPTTDDDVVAILDRAAHEGRQVRVRGTGHSNMPLCATDDVLIAPDGLTGVVAIANDRSTVRVRSGTVLNDLAAALHDEGLALHNLGDIDVQTIAGAVGTATHGTGPTLSNLAARVRAARVVLADGRIVDCDDEHEPELFAALRPSLGAVGIITEFTLDIIPTYNLHERIEFGPGDAVLETLDERIAASRHYEFFWHPHRDLAEHKALALTDSPPDPLVDRKRERVDHWHRVLPSRRELRFNEMEYSVPARAGPSCFAALRERMRTQWPDVQWPVEYRTVARDDLWISPHAGDDAVTISVHQGADLPCDDLFADTERLLIDHGGRPHWGKVHRGSGPDLAVRYPNWNRWWDVRDRVDPNERFLNDHLRAMRV